MNPTMPVQSMKMSLRPSELIPVLLAALRAKMNVLLTGRPGIGKTEIIKLVVSMLKWQLQIVHLSVHEPPDLRGLPAASKTKDGRSVADFHVYGFLRTLVEATEPIVCFMDDLGTTAPATQSSAMQLWGEREVGGHKISDSVVFVGATNRREDGAGVQGLNKALADRMTLIIELESDANDWVEWGVDHNIHPTLLAYARLAPEVVEEFEQTRDIVKGHSPRSLEGLSDILHQIDKGAKCFCDPRIFASAIGAKHGIPFYAFYKTWSDLPDRETIISDPMGAPIPDVTRPDVAYALMGSLAYAASPENFDAIVTYLERLPQPDFGMKCVTEATKLTPALKQTSACIRWYSKHAALYGIAKES